MSGRVPPFSLEQIGTGTVRFPSGAPIPHISDASVDPYVQTRMPKDASDSYWRQQSSPRLVGLLGSNKKAVSSNTASTIKA